MAWRGSGVRVPSAPQMPKDRTRFSSGLSAFLKDTWGLGRRRSEAEPTAPLSAGPAVAAVRAEAKTTGPIRRGTARHPPVHPTLELPDLLRLIDERATAFRAVVASAADLDAPVPSCPGWTLADLAQHI